MTDVAEGVHDLTPGWITNALAAAGHTFEVVGVEATRIGTGQMGTTYRLALTYTREPGPATLIAKLTGLDEAMRALVAPGYAAEVGFYRDLAAQLDVRTPGCWYAAISPDNTVFTLLLDDIELAVPGVQADGCSVAQARASIRNLVGLHAPRWGDPTLLELDFLMRPSEPMAAMMQDVLVGATDTFVDRYEGRLDDGNDALLREVAGVIGEWQLARLEPASVLHGDYRLDNLLFPPTGADVVAVDWQTAAVGPPLRDVAYFLGTSLPTDDRRAHEEQLVAEYHAAILDRGVADYDADRCWDDYRIGHLQGPMITILGCIYASGVQSERSDRMFLAMANRSCAAIRDLDSLALL